MPRGFGGVREVSADLESRRGSGGSGALWFRLKPNEETVVRFLEQDDDIFWATMHEVPVDNREWGRDVPCLDQDKEGVPCPGCERDLPKRFKGYINLIWFDAPVLKRDNDNKIVKDRLGDPVVLGNKAQVAVWSSGIRLFEELDEINANYKGLTSCKFRVKRKGEGLSTKYSIAPEDVSDVNQPFSDEETKLAAEKYDLNQFTQPTSYDEFLKELGQGGGQQQQNGGGGNPNPFLRNR